MGIVTEEMPESGLAQPSVADQADSSSAGVAQLAIPCTACEYCVTSCPKGIAIPQYFALYNEDMSRGGDREAQGENAANYTALTSEHGKASDCIGCGRCEISCPEHLPIIDYMKDIAAHYGQ